MVGLLMAMRTPGGLDLRKGHLMFRVIYRSEVVLAFVRCCVGVRESTEGTAGTGWASLGRSKYVIFRPSYFTLIVLLFFICLKLLFTF